jgi:hypothetical protein
VKKLKKSRKKGGTGPYLGFLQKRPKNSVFLMFFRVFPLENQGRLTEETRSEKGGQNRVFLWFFSKFFKKFLIFLCVNKYFLWKKLFFYYKKLKDFLWKCEKVDFLWFDEVLGWRPVFHVFYCFPVIVKCHCKTLHKYVLSLNFDCVEIL